MKCKVLGLAYVVGAVCLLAEASPLNRKYTEGEKLTYLMDGMNDNWTYDLQANGIVLKEGAGKYVEEFGWTGVNLNAESLAFRQKLSLAPDARLSIPDLSKVQPQMISPITDLVTFYADIQVAHTGSLSHAGDHFYFEFGAPNSWADGTTHILGQDAIDFDVTLTKLDAEKNTAELSIKHVPPKKPQVSLPSEWMRKPVAGTPNNWVDVAKQNGKYIAQVGQETFDVRIVLDSKDGKILTAGLENRVEILKRECADAELTNCGLESRSRRFRKVGMELVR
jgi:hypothetical protein